MGLEVMIHGAAQCHRSIGGQHDVVPTLHCATACEPTQLGANTILNQRSLEPTLFLADTRLCQHYFVPALLRPLGGPIFNFRGLVAISSTAFLVLAAMLSVDGTPSLDSSQPIRQTPPAVVLAPQAAELPMWRRRQWSR